MDHISSNDSQTPGQANASASQRALPPVAMDALLEKPLGKKRALLIAIQHISCKTGSEFDGLSDLHFTHRDAEALRDFLIASHGYQLDDIVLMKDDISYPKHLWPTHRKILHQIDQLTTDVPEDCHFFFYYSGHGLEEECHDRLSTRADGRDDEIVTADGKPILDHILHDRLIVPLQKIKGSKLFALFDCCHSETLLDLQRGSEPNYCERVWDHDRDQMFKVIVHAIGVLSELNKRHCGEDHRAPRQASTKRSSPPVAKIHVVEQLSVICLSACRDGQLAHDYGEMTFTKCFLEAAETRPNITWTELRDVVKWELISKIKTKYEAVSHEPCLQSPMYSISSQTDLARAMSL